MERPVSKLRPKAPTTATDSQSIYDVAVKMAANRVDAALLLDESGSLSGIITDNDITRRVVSQNVDVSGTKVDSVMTRNPKCVHSEDSALDALEMMVDNRFRHLPVLDKNDAVVGLLDIAKCLYDAISILEKVQEKEENGGDAAAVMAAAMTTAMKATAGKRGNNAAQLEMMQMLMSQMFGGSVPTLRKVIESSGETKMPSVQPTSTVREASLIMAKLRKGVLVMDGKGSKSSKNDLVGIFTPKDLLSRVIAKGLNPDETTVSQVMTPNPDSVSADLTLLDALKEMHDHKFLHLPVRESSGKVIGLVDVMDLVSHSAGEGGGKGWRDFFSGAMAARGDDDISDSASEISRHAPAPIRAKYLQTQQTDSCSLYSDGRAPIPIAKGYGDHAKELSQTEFDFKVTDSDGYLHKIKCVANSLDHLRTVVAEKLGVDKDALLLKYIDDEKDEVLLTSDSALHDAVHTVRQTGSYSVKLITIVNKEHAAKKLAKKEDDAVVVKAT
eukprot:gene21549-22443_t